MTLPVVYSQIHSGIRHSDGFATEVTALPVPQYPPSLLRVVRLLTISGIVAFIYILIELGRLGLETLMSR